MFLATGTSKDFCAKPIIGPPRISLPGSAVTPPANSIALITGVPIFSSQLPGFFTTSPVMVVTRSTSGMPRQTASVIAAAVPTF